MGASGASKMAVSMANAAGGIDRPRRLRHFFTSGTYDAQPTADQSAPASSNSGIAQKLIRPSAPSPTVM
jgi:hypothetical protein